MAKKKYNLKSKGINGFFLLKIKREKERVGNN